MQWLLPALPIRHNSSGNIHDCLRHWKVLVVDWFQVCRYRRCPVQLRILISVIIFLIRSVLLDCYTIPIAIHWRRLSSPTSMRSAILLPWILVRSVALSWGLVLRRLIICHVCSNYACTLRCCQIRVFRFLSVTTAHMLHWSGVPTLVDYSPQFRQ